MESSVDSARRIRRVAAWIGPERLWFLIWVALPVCAFLMLLVGRNWNFFLNACEYQTDYELISLNVENAKHLQAWTGAYSRFQIRHPGPAAFYWYAVIGEFFSFVSRPLGRYALAQFVLNAGLLLTFSYCIFRLLRPRSLALLAAAMLIVLCAGSSGTSLTVLSDVWNPFPAIVAMAALLACGALVARGAWQFLFPQACAFVIVSQSHLGGLPVAVVVLTASVLIALYARQRGLSMPLSKFQRWAVAGAIAVVAAAFSPVIYEAMVRPAGGNIGAIFRFVSSGRDRQDLWVVLADVGAQYAKVLRPLPIPSWLAIISIFTLLWLPSRGGRGLQTAKLLGTLAFLASVYSLRRTQGELFPYLLLYHFGIVAFVLALSVANGVLLLRALPNVKARAASSTVAAIFAALFCVLALRQLWAPAPYRTNCGAHGEAKRFLQVLNPQHGMRYRLTMRDENLWHSLVRLALVMKRSGYEVCVDRKWWYVFDSSLVCSSDVPSEAITLYDLSKGPRPADLRGLDLRSVGVSISSVPVAGSAE